MAKIQKYNINPNPPTTYKCDNSDYIKVSELREFINNLKDDISKISDNEISKDGRAGGQAALIALLAAIDTEEK